MLYVNNLEFIQFWVFTQGDDAAMYLNNNTASNASLNIQSGT